MKIIKIAIALMFSITSTAQIVYESDYIYRNTIKVCIVDNESQADVLIYTTDDINQARNNDCVWYSIKNQSQAQYDVMIVDNLSQADIKIYLVDHPYQARWKDNSKRIKFKMRRR